MTRQRKGVVLLEALLALALVAAASASMIGLLLQAKASERSVREHDQALSRADRLMASVSLWSRSDLDRHLGVRRQGEWLLEIQQRAANLYDVELRDSLSRRVLLATSVVPRSP